MRAISRNENAERRHHGGIRRNAENFGLQPGPTEQSADQRPSDFWTTDLRASSLVFVVEADRKRVNIELAGVHVSAQPY